MKREIRFILRETEEPLSVEDISEVLGRTFENINNGTVHKIRIKKVN